MLMLSKICNFHSDIEPRIYNPWHTTLYNAMSNGLVLLIPSGLQQRHQPMILVVSIVGSPFYRSVEYARECADIGIINSIPATPHPPPRSAQVCKVGRTCWGGREVKWQNPPWSGPTTKQHSLPETAMCETVSLTQNCDLIMLIIETVVWHVYVLTKIYLSNGYDSDSLCNFTLGLSWINLSVSSFCSTEYMILIHVFQYAWNYECK